MAPSGVFCVEGQWHRDLTGRGSVLPTLELLERCQRVKFIHKDVAAREELEYYLGRWALRQYADYRVGFFAMHGVRRELCLTDGQSISLEQVAEILDGKCRDRLFYFGSCSVLNASQDFLADFLGQTGATMLCGYTRSVDWVESAAFETVLLNALANGHRIDAAEKLMTSARWAPLASHLGFKVVYANGRRTWVPPRPRPENGDIVSVRV